MTNKTLLEQITLMKWAIEVDNDIATLERLIKPVDEITFKVMQDELRARYMDVMAKLFSNLLITSNAVEV
jgi:hypothetical protein